MSSYALVRKVVPQAVDRVKYLIGHKGTEQFVQSAKKQKAEIMSDVIMPYFNDSAFFSRVVTKKLPTGTTITKAFEEGHERAVASEVISKTHHAVSNGHCAMITQAKNKLLIKDDRGLRLVDRAELEQIPNGWGFGPLNWVVGLTGDANRCEYAGRVLLGDVAAPKLHRLG